MSMARKKWPRGMGLGLPVARSSPQMSSPQGPDWKAVERSSTVAAHPYPLVAEFDLEGDCFEWVGMGCDEIYE